MPVLQTLLDPRSDAFHANAAAMRALVADLREKSAAIAGGGDEAARKRHEGRGKLLPRERIRLLLDPGSPFLELSAFDDVRLFFVIPPEDQVFDRLPQFSKVFANGRVSIYRKRPPQS